MPLKPMGTQFNITVTITVQFRSHKDHKVDSGFSWRKNWPNLWLVSMGGGARLNFLTTHALMASSQPFVCNVWRVNSGVQWLSKFETQFFYCKVLGLPHDEYLYRQSSLSSFINIVFACRSECSPRLSPNEWENFFTVKQSIVLMAENPLLLATYLQANKKKVSIFLSPWARRHSLVEMPTDVSTI